MWSTSSKSTRMVFFAARIWLQWLQDSTIIGPVITIRTIRKEKQQKEI